VLQRELYMDTTMHIPAEHLHMYEVKLSHYRPGVTQRVPGS